MSTVDNQHYPNKAAFLTSNFLTPCSDEFLTTKSIEPQNGLLDVPFMEMIHEMASKYPEKSAIEFFDQTMTYQELETRSNQLAALLLDKGLSEGNIIGIAMDRSIDMIVAILGVAKSGCAYLPLDPNFPTNRLNYMLEDAGAKLIITSNTFESAAMQGIEQLSFKKISDMLFAYQSWYFQRKQSPSSLAYILYTSGSTGKPKGVQISHRNLSNFLLSVRKKPGMYPSDKLLAITTISFDIACLEMFLPLISGATIVLADSLAIKDGRTLLKLLIEKGITFMQATPATWRMLSMAGWDKSLPLRVLSGGEAFPKDLANKLLSLSQEVWNGYGPTETTIYSTMKKLEIGEEKISIGVPIDHTQVYILDENMQQVEDGEVGEIYISGEGVSLGYLGRKDLTQERFVVNPFDDQHPVLYQTGDLGKTLPNGEIECLGRIDHQVKIRGYRIELGEIEQQLLREEEISEVAVEVWEDIPGNKRLVAYIVLSEKGNSDSSFDQHIGPWKELLSTKLPSYMIPTDWVKLERLPLTANNKIDRKALPSPNTAKIIQLKEGQKPVSDTQELIHNIWSKSLGIAAINIDDDFFDLGGHSLLTVDVMTKLDIATGKNLPLTALFQHPTIRKFASYLDTWNTESHQEDQWRSLVPIRTSGTKTPIYLVHGMAANASTFFKLLNLLDKNQPIYGFQSKGLSGQETPNYTIEEMAEHYVNEIINQNPDGPYILGGYSFGGFIAYEMAAILRKMGKGVDHILLFDTQATSISPLDQENDSKLSQIGKTLSKRKVEFQVMFQAPKTFQKIKSRVVKRKKQKLLQKLGLIPKPEANDRTSIIKKIRSINHQAMLNYSPSPQEVNIVLFKAKIIPNKSLDHKTNGWSDYAKGVKVIPVNGDHFTLFEEPFIFDLGKKLNHFLEEPV
ncbi:amino acid adenylation domain-containing protein [Echinicola sp. CAU 1574]|uniref:Amino acid adenylation domain-containing protein n=1 Tax=Echinicola arenosa TaxID=2774144 RepID=A0ABR9ALB1_9BACT|nr:amino acid adenylation domain-containing protein [Echinicola arenosa]MBD8489586.1 amino acid adenylation domain-containing protein [Echinicola arenosa]